MVCALRRFLFLAAVLSAPAAAQCTNEWLPGNGVPGVDSGVFASTMWDPDGSGPAAPRLVVAGGFALAGTVPANRIAAWDPATGTWSAAFGAGMDDVIRALQVMPNGDLVAAGDFMTAGGVSAARIAKWDGTSWSPLGAGLQAWAYGVGAYALTTLPNGDLVAGGNFAWAGSVSAPSIARWDGTSWSALGSGTSGAVYSLTTLSGGDLVAGGWFLMAGGVSANNIARWNGTAWSPLGAGITSGGAVEALTTAANGDVIAGSGFTAAWGSTGRVARWNGASWSSLGVGFDSIVRTLSWLPTGDLVAGGEFTTTGGRGASLPPTSHDGMARRGRRCRASPAPMWRHS